MQVSEVYGTALQTWTESTVPADSTASFESTEGVSVHGELLAYATFLNFATRAGLCVLNCVKSHRLGMGDMAQQLHILSSESKEVKWLNYIS